MLGTTNYIFCFLSVVSVDVIFDPAEVLGDAGEHGVGLLGRTTVGAVTHCAVEFPATANLYGLLDG